MSRNVAASIRARLRNRMLDTGEDFGLLLTRYGCERFLYRLGQSTVRDHYILKGATLLVLWMAEPYRATRDIDVLALVRNDEAAIREAVEAICKVPCPEDGLTFDPGTLKISTMAALIYQGQRARLTASLGNTKIHVKVDLGFGDIVTSETHEDDFPTLLDGVPAPRLRTYPRVTVVAEKLEAVVKLGRGNSRMKDFFDLWALSEGFDFDGPALRKAIVGCFERRGTPWAVDMPHALRQEFYSEDDTLINAWQSYLGTSGLLAPPPENFEDIGKRIRTFIGPIRKSVISGDDFDMHWSAGGPWRPCEDQNQSSVPPATQQEHMT